MRILRYYRNVPQAACGAVVALGNFDGLHRGHRAVIAEAGRIAEQTLSNRYGMPVCLPDVDRYLFGTPEDCIETIAAYRAVGVAEFVLNTVRPVPEVVAEVEKFAERVLMRVG